MTEATLKKPIPMLRLPSLWRGGVLLLAIVLTLPLITVFSSVFKPAGEVWHHLADTVLQDYVVNSLALMVGVTAGTLSMGVICAWLTSMCRFPGRRVFDWALLLPLAFPAYIIAYTYTGLFDFAGPVQTALRGWFGWGYGDYWFPEVRSLAGAMAMLSLVLYPYVYLLARAAFLDQSAHTMDAARILGASPLATFFRVVLPGARPAIIAGLSLALMETLADYGTVQYFGVSTFTTGIFRTWFGLGDPSAASQLAALLMVFVFALMTLERWSRRRARYFEGRDRSRPVARFELTGGRAWLATVACFLPLCFGFLLPGAVLLGWAIETAPRMVDASFVGLALNSVLLASGAAGIALVLALFLAYGRRMQGSWLVNGAVRMAAMGYAIPGTVIAVGVLIPFGLIDNAVDGYARAEWGFSTGLLLSGTLAALLFAYTVRFLAVSLQTVESGLGKIKPVLDESAQMLGYRPREILRQIHVPLMRGSLLTAVLVVFVDVMKELPATLILRPFNFNTLAVRAYELAADERLVDSSSAAIAIVLVGIIPVLLLSRSIARTRAGGAD